MNFGINKKSHVYKLREKMFKKGYELIDITHLCKLKIDSHGNCNNLNEPNENIYHIKVMYRNEIIANAGTKMYPLDETKYLIYNDVIDVDFIIFKIVKK